MLPLPRAVVQRESSSMAITQIIYSSQPFGFDSALLSNILLDARRCNARDGITGALVCRRDIYLQFLEGQDELVYSTLDRIRRDDRHTSIKVHLDAPAPARLFADWDMLHDPAHTWAWSEAEIDAGALDHVTPQEALAVFTAIAQRQSDTV
jgi:hypothetical protein